MSVQCSHFRSIFLSHKREVKRQPVQQQKLTEHCKSTITEKIKIFKKKNSKVYEQVKKQDIEESVEYKSYLYNFFKECTHIDLERYPSMLTVVLLGE